MNFIGLFLVTFVFTFFAFVQQAESQTQSRSSDNRPRVFIEESESWEIESDPVFSSTDKKGRVTISGGETKGGAKPRTAEIMKRFTEQCKNCVVTMYREKADFIVRLDHEGGKDIFNKDNKLAVFNREGDLIASGSFSRLRKAVETACQAITQESAVSLRTNK
jgi:hypothetical protein